MSYQWMGPYPLDAFVAPERGTYPELYFKGVYRLQLLEGDGSPAKLNRLLRADPTGTLYVGGVPRGVASTVFGRVQALARSVGRAPSGDWVNHRGGWNLHVFGLLDALGTGLGAAHGGRTLVIHALADSSWGAADSSRIEAELLLRYRGLFGDNPPANLSTGSIGQVTKVVRDQTKVGAALSPDHWFV